jgi:hypothetical protein
VACPEPLPAAFHARFTPLAIVLLILSIALRETLTRVGFLRLASSFGLLFSKNRGPVFPLPGHPSLWGI